MRLLQPQLLLFAIPILWAAWRWRGRHPITQALRLTIAALLLLTLCGPYLRTAARGRDLVICVDRSRSMPSGSRELALETIRLAEDARRAGDRVSVISFGARPILASLPTEELTFSGFDSDVQADGSDLGAALELALDTIPKNRPGTVLLLSDGEENGSDTLVTARRAFARGTRIDVRPLRREGRADLSLERIDLPETVSVSEPFQFSVWVHSDREIESDFVLKRDGATLSSGRRRFQRGLNRLVFRDILDTGGVARYEVELDTTGDRIPENNRGQGAVLAHGTRPILVLTQDGLPSSLSQAMSNARIPVRVAQPGEVALDPVSLTRYRAVVLENVPADSLGRGVIGLRDFVLERGGGLLVTGGRASFGVGGYFRSQIDDLLPVSMELRQENRKIGIALAIPMDRSGSMGMTVPGGMKKMDLANLGAAAAIELLTPLDSVSVIAVDSGPHVVLPLTDVGDPGALVEKVLSIEPGGGGIYVHTALLAAARELDGARQVNRHITLFSDAADSEEQEGCLDMATEMLAMGVTISIIALGTEEDPDAGFLKDLAVAGEGDCYFTTDPADLPRLFAQDTIKSARAAFVDVRTATRVLPDLFGLGELPGETAFPDVAGYNLTYLRDSAVAGVMTTDENLAPLFAFHYKGLGRVAAYTGQVGGKFGADVVAWDGFESFFVTASRWLSGQEEPREFFTTVERHGNEAIVSVEVDPEAGNVNTRPLSLQVRTASGNERRIELDRVEEHRFEARYPLDESGVALATISVGDGRFLTLPPLVLPYSPEFERSPDPERGLRVLRRLAQETGGQVEPTASQFFEGPREFKAWRMISRELWTLAIVLLLIEIAGRRLALWPPLRVPGWITRRSGSNSPEPAAEEVEPAPVAAPRENSQEAPEAVGHVRSALEQARRKSRGRLDRR